MSAALRRGLSHIFCGLSIVIAALFWPRTPVLVSLGTLTFAFLALELIRLRVMSVNKLFCRLLGSLLRDTESCRVTGASYLLVASVVTLLVFRRDIALLALSFLAIGDPLATLFRNERDKSKLSGKAVAGALACFASCVAAGWLFYYTGSSVSLSTILLGAAVASSAEALPLPIDDNLTIPLLAGLAMTVAPF